MWDVIFLVSFFTLKYTVEIGKKKKKDDMYYMNYYINIGKSCNFLSFFFVFFFKWGPWKLRGSRQLLALAQGWPDYKSFLSYLHKLFLNSLSSRSFLWFYQHSDLTLFSTFILWYSSSLTMSHYIESVTFLIKVYFELHENNFYISMNGL